MITVKSYRTIYIVALVLILLMFGASAYYYLQFRRIEDKEVDKHMLMMTKNSALLLTVISAFGILTLTVLFFGLPNW